MINLRSCSKRSIQIEDSTPALPQVKPSVKPAPLMSDLFQGDCLTKLKTMSTASIEAVLTDPPYAINIHGQVWDKSLPIKAIWSECLRVLKPGGLVAAFAAPKNVHKLAIALESAGFEIRDTWVWHYPNGTPACQQIEGDWCGRVKPGHEAIVLARKPLETKKLKDNFDRYGTGGVKTKSTLNDDQMTTSVFNYKKSSPKEKDLGVEHFKPRLVGRRQKSKRSLCKTTYRKNNHPCVKPVALMYHLCKLLAAPGSTVIDPFMGSGATGMAAAWAGVRFVGCELDSHFFSIAQARIQHAAANEMPSYIAQQLEMPQKAEKPKRTPKKVKPSTNATRDGSIDKREVSSRGHTEETLPPACSRPNIANLPLDRLGLVKVRADVFYDTNAPRVWHRKKARQSDHNTQDTDAKNAGFPLRSPVSAQRFGKSLAIARTRQGNNMQQVMRSASPEGLPQTYGIIAAIRSPPTVPWPKQILSNIKTVASPQSTLRCSGNR